MATRHREGSVLIPAPFGTRRRIAAHKYNRAMDAAESPAPIIALLENHRAFLRYLEPRVGDRALAEDILQEAFAKVVAHPEQAPADESVIPWFYRSLRNAAIDQFRRRGAANRAYEAFARSARISFYIEFRHWRIQ